MRGGSATARPRSTLTTGKPWAGVRSGAGRYPWFAQPAACLPGLPGRGGSQMLTMLPASQPQPRWRLTERLLSARFPPLACLPACLQEEGAHATAAGRAGGAAGREQCPGAAAGRHECHGCAPLRLCTCVRQPMGCGRQACCLAPLAHRRGHPSPAAPCRPVPPARGEQRRHRPLAAGQQRCGRRALNLTRHALPRPPGSTTAAGSRQPTGLAASDCRSL